jgi:xanthine dehydrogenase small subunit
MQIRNEIRFILNGRDIVIDNVEANQTLLDFLRLDQRLMGTKEGCAEGDCGACTVLVGRLTDETLKYESVNACIRFLASLDGCHVVSVEYLSGPNGKLHPVQQAMVEHHGSQCGFCTPGFVMSLYALWMENPNPSEKEIETALQGNLCRCTGYEPIIKAALAINQYASPASDNLMRERDAITARLQGLHDDKRVVVGPKDNQAIIPADVDDLANVLIESPNATIIAGSTDVGLWVTKFLRPISPAVFIGHLDGLKSIELTKDALEIGAGVTYSESQDALSKLFPHLDEYWDRIAGWQIRNMGTVGGNIANGSPIGDTPPVLIALNALLTLRKGTDTRTMPLEEFFIDYGKQDRAQSEFVQSIVIPRPAKGQIDSAYKISKRRDEDISSVAVGISVDVSDGIIVDCRIAFGGMAATPKRAKNSETALRGEPWNKQAFDQAATELEKDFSPLTDWRASAEYRMSVSRNLLRRFFLEHDSATTQPIKLASA